MKKIVMWLIKVLHIDVQTEVVKEVIKTQYVAPGIIEGDVYIEGDLKIKGRLTVTGDISCHTK